MRSSFRRAGVAAVGACLLLAGGCSRPRVERLEWTSMGTVAAIQVRGDWKADDVASTCERVKGVWRRIERALNAHDADSEISRLAAEPDEVVVRACSPFVRACYQAAFDLRRLSGGAFDPRWRGAATLDLGAIAKGFAVDEAAKACADAPGDLLLDLGGNLKSVRGVWRVGVLGTDETILLEEGMACATSATYFRGAHIRDARTGLAVTNGVSSVTVVHPTSAMAADGLSTTLFVLGREKGEAFLKAHVPAARAYWGR